MITFCTEVVDVLKDVRNQRFCFDSSCIIVDFYSGSLNRRGLVELESGSVSKLTRGGTPMDGYLLFDMGSQPFIPHETKTRWKKSLIEFLESGINVEPDIPEYVFIIWDVSYTGSRDYFVVVNNILVML